MRLRYFSICILILISACVVSVSHATAQEQNPPGQEDVLRVDTVLVQTDVMVFDKKGNFVDGLKRDQFGLKIDGKPREITFFEGVRTGSRNEEAQLAAARSNRTAADAPKNVPEPSDRGRTIYFLADDIHLSPSSSTLTRKLFLHFIDQQMGQNDLVAITSASGQIGFLQQLTDNKAVLRAAADRLKYRNYAPGNIERPPMSEFQALKVDQEDRDVLDYYIDQVLKDIPFSSRDTAASMVHQRASQILHQTAAVTNNTLVALESLVRNTRYVPGRKIVFFISDGFFLDPRNSDAQDRVRQITSLAAATGAIIYSIDARGLSTGMEDASADVAYDPTGRLQRGASAGAALGASQDGMNALATDTGGRAFLNSNDLSAGITTGLKETSNYYLLAWRPENEDQKSQKFRRIEVSVIGRDDLTVRFRRGFGEIKPEPVAAKPNKSDQTDDKQTRSLLGQALGAVYPRRELPVALMLNYVDDPVKGITLSASLKVSTASMRLEAGPQGPSSATLDFAGTIYDDQGKSVSAYSKRVAIQPLSNSSNPPNNILYHYTAGVKPGLYQMRAAALDVSQKRTGSAVQWIEIPDLSTKKLAMSTLIVGEKRGEPETEQTADKPRDLEAGDNLFRDIRLNVDHLFARSSRLRFLTYFYNVQKAPGNSPTSGSAGENFDLSVQVQVFRDNEPVLNPAPGKVVLENASDLVRIPYTADVPLQDLQPGRYLLKVTITDNLAKASASQEYAFQIN
jgi:VWFA-related protein